MGGQQYERNEAVAIPVLPAINFPYIQKVLAHIEGNLLRLEMRSYWEFPAEYLSLEEMEGVWPECGTRACFAGWGVFLSIPNGWPKDTGSMADFLRTRGASTYIIARDLFGFTDDEAGAVFEGNACTLRGPERQLVALKESLNKVFENRGMTERV